MLMARRLDHATGAPVWTAYPAPRVATARLTRDVRCDALVVGLGISGAMITESLAAQGLSVIGVDRRGPMRGSTAATTALVQFEIDEPLTGLRAMIGHSAADQAWRRSRLAVVNLRGRIAELGIDCDLATRSTLYLAGSRLGPGDLRREAEARGSAGLRATYLAPRALKERFGIDRRGAILSQDNLALDPRRLTAGLLNRARERKARFYAPVDVTDIADGQSEVAVATRGGPGIVAKYLVLATGYELLDCVPSDTHAIVSTYAIATRPQPRAIWPGAALIWEASDPYLYLRATSDGRVICGGEDEEVADQDTRDGLLPAKTARLSAKLHALFAHLDTRAAFAWTGFFGTTRTGLPFIGALPGRPRVFAIQGYGGNGITYSQIASELVATTIAGREDADATLFGFRRRGLTRSHAPRQQDPSPPPGGAG